MSIEIVLTALSAGMEEAKISRWLKVEGDNVSKGDVLAEIETDKATMELEAESDGKVGKIFVADGETAKVGSVIAVLLEKGEDVASIKTPAEQSDKGNAGIEKQPISSVATPLATTTEKAAVSPVKASPLAKRLARQYGIELSGLRGSGPKGRIVRIDVERARTTPQNNADQSKNVQTKTGGETALVGLGNYTAIAHSTMRRVIARRLTESKTTVPHFYLNRELLIDDLLALRQQLNEKSDGSYKISVNDLVIKAAAKALQMVPHANVIWTEDAMLQFEDVDISVAVATEGGLITPVIRQADRLGIGAISSSMKVLAQKAREGRLMPNEYQGGAFCISNLGMYGVDSFSAIVNPPQSAILAVGAARKKPVEKNDTVQLGQVMSCTLSVDHRALDGALAAELLAAFATTIENPMSLLI